MKGFLFTLLLAPTLAFGQALPSPRVANLPGSPLSSNAINIGNTTYTNPVTTGSNTFNNYGLNQGVIRSTITGSKSAGAYNAVDWLFTSQDFSNNPGAGNRIVNAFAVQHNFGGSGDIGGFAGTQSTILLTAPTGNGLAGEYSSGTFIAVAGANDNGTGTTDGTAGGILYGLNPNVRLTSGATNWRGLVGQEIDIAAYAGSSVFKKIGLSIIGLGDVVQASMFSAAIDINSSSGTPGWMYGLSFGDYDGSWPMAATGSMIGCFPHANTGACGTTAHGVNLSNITFTSDAFLSNGFVVDGSGNVGANTVASAVHSGATPGAAFALGGSPATYNSLQVIPNTSTNVPSLSVVSPNTNLGLTISSQGSGAAVGIGSSQGASLSVTNDGTGAQNSWVFHSVAAGAGVVYVAPQGNDTNISTRIQTKGNGTVQLYNGVVSGGTKFTTSGCSVSATTGGGTAGTFTLGANSCTVVVTLAGATGAVAPNGWTCDAHDRTAPTLLIGGESSSTTTTASFTIPAGAGATDVISFSCLGF